MNRDNNNNKFGYQPQGTSERGYQPTGNGQGNTGSNTGGQIASSIPPSGSISAQDK